MRNQNTNLLGETSPANNLTRLNGSSNGNGTYGGSDLAPKVAAIVERKIITPEINKVPLRAQAFTSGRAGESAAREMADHTYGAANNQHKEEIHGIVEFLNHQIAGSQKHINEISGGMNPNERYVRSQTAGTPWTRADSIKCGLLYVIAVVVLGIDINTNATVLQNSGIAAFEKALNAYLFSAIPIALAACLKALASHIDDSKRRRTYIVGVWVIGFLFGVLWAYLFAGTFRGITQSTADIIRSLGEPGTSDSAHTGNVAFIFCAMMAGAFLSSGCVLTAQTITEKHQLEKITDNPVYLKQQADLDRWQKIKHDYVQMRSQLTGKLQAIEDGGRSYIEHSVAYFRAAVKAASDNQRLDDFLES